MNSTTLGALLADYEAQALTVLPAGTYEAEVVSCRAREVDVIPVLKILAGEHVGKRVLLGVFTPAQLAPMGFEVDAAGGTQAAAAALAGVVGSFEIEQVTYGSEIRNRLVRVLACSGPLVERARKSGSVR